jgi:hypothetical protein
MYEEDVRKQTYTHCLFWDVSNVPFAFRGSFVAATADAKRARAPPPEQQASATREAVPDQHQRQERTNIMFTKR